MKSYMTHILPVNYDLPLEIITKIYAWRASDITTLHFPPTRKGTVQIPVTLLSFDRAIHTPDVLTEFRRTSHRPIDLCELVALDNYCHAHYEFPLLALGSLWKDQNGHIRFPYSRGWRTQRLRFLYLYGIGHLWDTSCGFPAVHEPELAV